MLFMDMIIKVLVVLFKSSSILPTNVTTIFLIISHLISPGSKFSKSVDGDTTHNVSEKKSKENVVDEVSDKSHEIETFH